MLAVVISGAYLMASAWGRVPWLIVTVGSLVVVIVLSVIPIGIEILRERRRRSAES